MELNDTLKARLITLLSQRAVWRGSEIDDIALDRVVFEHEGANLVGHVLLDLLEEQGFLPDDIAAVVAADYLATGIAMAISQAAYSRGLDIDVQVYREGEAALLGPSLSSGLCVLIGGVDGVDEISQRGAQLAVDAGMQLCACLELYSERVEDNCVVGGQEVPWLIGLTPGDLIE